MSRLRVVNLALPKTGTTTLTDALRQAGLTVADWKIRAGQSQREDIPRMHLGKSSTRTISPAAIPSPGWTSSMSSTRCPPCARTGRSGPRPTGGC